MKRMKKLSAWLLIFAMILGMIPVNTKTAQAAEAKKATKVVVSVEGQTLSQGFYIEPTIVTFDEFINYWGKKGQTVMPENITAGGVLQYALQKNGTPMDAREEVTGPGYLAAIKGIDKGYAQLPQFLADAGVTLSKTSDTPGSELREKEYSPGAGWMYTEGNDMSLQALAGHKFYTYGRPYTQDGETYYVVRLQYSVAGLGADLGFDFNGTMPYSYKAADKGQLYILYAKLSESGILAKIPAAKEKALDVMNTLRATQATVDAAYEELLSASQAEKPVITENLTEEPVKYGMSVPAEPLKVSATVGQGTLSYEWFKSNDKKNWTSCGKGESYTPSTAQNRTVYYKCVVTNQDELTGLVSSVESKMATVIIGVDTPFFEKDLSEAEEKYIYSDSPEPLTIEASITDGGILSYQWYVSEDGKNWDAIAEGTQNTYTPSVKTIGTKYYKCTVTNTAGQSSQSADSKTAMITSCVDAPVFTQNLRTTTYYPTFDEECILTVAATAGEGGKVTYQWYTTENPSETDLSKMTLIQGATGTSYRVDTSKPFASYFKVAAINTVQEKTAVTLSNWSRVDVKVKTPMIEQDLKREMRYLVGEKNPAALKVEASVSDAGELSYQWYESTDEEKPWSISEMTPIEGATENTYTPDTSTGYKAYYACRVTNTNRGETASDDTRICTVIVSCQQPVITKDLPDSVSYLAGEENPAPLEVEASVTDGGTLTYQWYQTDGYAWSIDGMELIEGAVSSSYTPDITKADMTYACRVTNTKDGYTAFADSNFVEVEITCAAPEITKNLDTKMVTYDRGAQAEALYIEATVSDGGELSYQWYCGESENYMNPIEGANTASHTPSTDAAGTLCYQAVVTNTKAGITNEIKSAVAKVKVLSPQEKISTEEELRAMNPNGNYILTEDIELTSPWTPIAKFSGTLDGDGHTISDFEMESNDSNGVAFFNTTGTGAVIKNLGLVGKVTQKGWSATAGLVGTTKGDGLVISNCYVNVEVIGSEYGHVAGLVGKIDHETLIENSYFVGTLFGGTSYAYAGGLAGQIYNNDVVIQNCYTTQEKAVGNYARYNAAETKNNYCASDKDEHAKKIPEDMSEFLAALNNGGDVYMADAGNMNDGYPILKWQEKAEESEPFPGTEEGYWGVRTEAKVYDDFQNDIWLQYQQKDMKVGETASLRPWRVEQVVTNTITNDVARPIFHFEIISGDSISLDTESSDSKAVVTAVKPGTTVVKVTYDAMDYKGQHWDAVSDVNTGYVVYTVGEKGTAKIECSEELKEWRHYDTIYYKEGKTVPYTFEVSADRAESVRVTLNGETVQGTDGKYTVNLENRSNIIGIEAKDAKGRIKSLYRVIDARFVEVKVENKTNPGEKLLEGDTANISLWGITMPVYKLATIYNPCMNGWGAEAAHTRYENEILGSFKGKCRQWDLAENNDFDVTFEKAGSYTFESPNGIYCEWWGKGLGADLTAEGSGEPGLGVPAYKGDFSKLPSFTVEVAKKFEKPVLPDMKNPLELAETYLKTHVTNPVVDTVCGEWSVLAMARYGVLPETTKANYLANLYQELDEKDGVLSTNSYTDYSRVVLALTAIGIYPGAVNGYNLLYPLADFEQVIWQGINGPIFALIALDSHDYEIPNLTKEDLNKGMVQTTRQGLIDYILSHQLADGGWSLYGMASDPDMTAMAIQALAPYYENQENVKAAVDRALTKLSQLQNENGGFSSWGVGNVESTVQTVIAFSRLDVNLLADERFVKNGNTMLDNLLTFQLADGSFKHMSNQEDADAMSTDQGTMALLAYERAVGGQKALYDMTDVVIDTGDGNGNENENETTEKVEAFRKKMNALPKTVFIKDQQSVYSLLGELDQMKQFEEKEAFRKVLKEKLDHILHQKKEVEALDQDIWDQINPLHITKEDAATIQKLLERYYRIPEENRLYVENREDLLDAYETLQKLQEDVPEEKPEENPSEENPSEENPSNENPSEEKVSGKKPSGKKPSGKKPAGKKDSSTVKADVKDNIVAKAELEKVKGKDRNLQMKGKEYTLTINGKDVKEVKDINIGLKYESPYDKEIHELADNPYILCFEQEGNFPGVMLAELKVDREDGKYLLMYYNPETQQAELVQKIEIKDKQTKFLIEKGGTYFVAKRVNKKSLKDTSTEEQEEQEEDSLESSKEEGAIQEIEQKVPVMVYIGIGIGIIAVAAGLWNGRRRRKKGGKNEKENL